MYGFIVKDSINEVSILAASRFITATIITASLFIQVQAGTDPHMEEALEKNGQAGRHYYELETRWVQNKKTNCARDAGVVEQILGQRDQGASLGEIFKTRLGKKRYYLIIAAQHWHDEGNARDTANDLYRYCIDNGTYWSPLGPLAS